MSPFPRQPDKPLMLLLDTLRVIHCKSCGVPVATRSRNRERCDSCIKARAEAKQIKTNEKRKRAREAR